MTLLVDSESVSVENIKMIPNIKTLNLKYVNIFSNSSPKIYFILSGIVINKYAPF